MASCPRATGDRARIVEGAMGDGRLAVGGVVLDTETETKWRFAISRCSNEKEKELKRKLCVAYLREPHWPCVRYIRRQGKGKPWSKEAGEQGHRGASKAARCKDLARCAAVRVSMCFIALHVLGTVLIG